VRCSCSHSRRCRAPDRSRCRSLEAVMVVNLILRCWNRHGAPLNFIQLLCRNLAFNMQQSNSTTARRGRSPGRRSSRPFRLFVVSHIIARYKAAWLRRTSLTREK
jgi:hypothetical protein